MKHDLAIPLARPETDKRRRVVSVDLPELPRDIICVILSLLSLVDGNAARLVCRCWHDLLQGWRHALALPRRGTHHTVEWSLESRGSQVQALWIRNKPSDRIQRLARLCLLNDDIDGMRRLPIVSDSVWEPVYLEALSLGAVKCAKYVGRFGDVETCRDDAIEAALRSPTAESMRLVAETDEYLLKDLHDPEELCDRGTAEVFVYSNASGPVLDYVLDGLDMLKRVTFMDKLFRAADPERLRHLVERRGIAYPTNFLNPTDARMYGQDWKERHDIAIERIRLGAKMNNPSRVLAELPSRRMVDALVLRGETIDRQSFKEMYCRIVDDPPEGAYEETLEYLDSLL